MPPRRWAASWSQVALRLTAEDISGNRIIYEADPAYLVPPILLYFPLVTMNAEPPQKPILTEYDLPDPSSYPKFIALDEQGEVWFTESSTNRIGRLAPPEEEITEWTVPTAESGPAGIADVDSPEAVNIIQVSA